MKSFVQLLSTCALALTFVGCATSDRHARYRSQRFYVIEEHPAGREVIIDREGNHTYVRDNLGSPHFQNNMEPRARGKHAEVLGWNKQDYYPQRHY